MGQLWDILLTTHGLDFLPVASGEAMLLVRPLFSMHPAWNDLLDAGLID